MKTSLAALALCFACHKTGIDDLIVLQPLTPLVDPLIGTHGSGNVLPGAQLPHGMVKLSPDTHGESGTIESYEYGDAKIEGFSHTHLEGPGGSGYGYSELLVTAERGTPTADVNAYSSAFTHDTEVARPGYYAVDLLDPGVRAELTATEHCGVHRYTFQAGAGSLVLDAGHTRGQSLGATLESTADSIEGTASFSMSPPIELIASAVQPNPPTGHRTLFFRAELSKPADRTGPLEKGAFASWDAPGAVEVRLCISYIDLAHARAHLAAEAHGRTFDELAAAAEKAWNKKLNRIQLEGGTDSARRAFYSALYRAEMQPSDMTEDGSFWSGSGKGAVLSDGGHRHFSDDWCLWDTFRTSHPLQLLLEPELRSDIVRSLVRTYQQGGWLEKCTWQATGYSRVMIGNHAVAVISDALQKGFRDFDVNLAYEAMRHAQMDENLAFLIKPYCGYFDLGTPPDYLTLGWVPYECDVSQSAAMTLELAFDDHALSRAAALLGKADDATLFAARAQNYKTAFNPAHGFMQPRRANGAFVEPFDPTDTSASNGFTEANAWIYTWFVPQDVKGLVSLLGGREAFVAKLDAYFDGGHHDASNEPSFETPWLYDFAGRPDRTQERVADLRARVFTNEPDGLPGNDDGGAMSSWYVFAVLGLYPSPAGPSYLIGLPAFPKATLWLDPAYFPGRSFVVETQGTGAYVQSATLDGKPWDQPWLSHDRLVAGGRLLLTLGAAPSAWGAAESAAPP